jgi:hypothetical protein
LTTNNSAVQQEKREAPEFFLILTETTVRIRQCKSKKQCQEDQGALCHPHHVEDTTLLVVVMMTVLGEVLGGREMATLAQVALQPTDE